MSGKRDRQGEMDSGLAKLLAQSLAFGAGAALWSANRVLDLGETVVDAFSPGQRRPAQADDRVWTDERLNRLRLPPYLFAISLRKAGRGLVEDLYRAALGSEDGDPDAPAMGGSVPRQCRQAFDKAFERLEERPLSEKAYVVCQAGGAPGRRWTVFHRPDPTSSDTRFTYFRLIKQGRSLEVTPAPMLDVSEVDASLLGLDQGVQHSLETLPSPFVDGFADSIAEVSPKPLAPQEGTIVYLGDSVVKVPVTRRAEVWHVQGPSLDVVLLRTTSGEAKRDGGLQAFFVGQPFKAPAGKKEIQELDSARFPQGLRAAFERHGYPLSGSMEVVKKASEIRWQIHDPETRREFSLVNVGLFIHVYPGAKEEDRYVDPPGDRIAEHFLGLAQPSQGWLHLLDHLVAGELSTFVNEAPLLNRGRPFEVLRWLHGHQHRVEPKQAGARGSFEMIRDFYRRAAVPPDWLVDDDRLARSDEAFSLVKIPYMTALLFGALPQTYSCWRGAQVLTATGRLAIDPRMPRERQVKRLQHRVAATAQFVLNIMEPGAFDSRTGRAVLTTLTVRLLHAGIRFVLRNAGSHRDDSRPPWRYGRLGRPINQEDMLGTMLAFSTVTFDKMRMLNVELSDRQEEALFHRWKLMGFHLGIREDLLRELRTPDDGRRLWYRIAERQQRYEKNKPSRAEAQNCGHLTAALIEYSRTVTTLGLPAEMAEYLVRYLEGDLIADRLGVPKTDLQIWPRAATLLGRVNVGVIDRLKDNSAAAREVISRINDVVYQAGFETWISKEQISYYRDLTEEISEFEEDRE